MDFIKEIKELNIVPNIATFLVKTEGKPGDPTPKVLLLVYVQNTKLLLFC